MTEEKDIHRTRWVLLSVWIVIFTLIVLLALVGLRREIENRTNNDKKLLTTVVDENYRQCIRGFTRISSLIKVALPVDQKDTRMQRYTLLLFADPKINCQKVTLKD